MYSAEHFVCKLLCNNKIYFLEVLENKYIQIFEKPCSNIWGSRELCKVSYVEYHCESGMPSFTRGPLETKPTVPLRRKIHQCLKNLILEVTVELLELLRS